MKTEITTEKHTIMHSTPFCFAWWSMQTWVVWLAVNGSTGAGNLVKTIAVLELICAIAVLEAIKKDRTRDPRPQWLKDVLCVWDIAIALTLAWFGWFWCAAAFILGAATLSAHRNRNQE